MTRSFFIQLFLVFVFFSFGCQSTFKQANLKRDRLFPYGSYFHKVTIFRGGKKIQTVNGVLIASPDRFELAALSPFNTTLFRVYRDKSKKEKVEIFSDEVRPHREKLITMFVLTERVFGLAMSVVDGKKNKEVKIREQNIKISDLDGNNIPKNINIQNREMEIQIENSSYKLD